LARAGHDVTVLERDPQPLPPDVDCAATWDRPTVPQTQHTQSVLALGRLILARKLPDVLDDLLAAGADCYPPADPVREPDLTTLAGPGRSLRSLAFEPAITVDCTPIWSWTPPAVAASCRTGCSPPVSNPPRSARTAS